MVLSDQTSSLDFDEFFLLPGATAVKKCKWNSRLTNARRYRNWRELITRWELPLAIPSKGLLSMMDFLNIFLQQLCLNSRINAVHRVLSVFLPLFSTPSDFPPGSSSGNSFRLAQIAESSRWEEQFPGLGKLRGNTGQVLHNPQLHPVILALNTVQYEQWLRVTIVFRITLSTDAT